MAGQKKLEAEIVIKGKADGSLSQVASVLKSIADQVQAISGAAQDVIRDSLDYYKDYEANMLDARGALTAQYDSYVDLDRVMKNLDTDAQNWAASTIFHTSDVSKAISEAAHAGWDYEKMVSGIPAAMQLAQAGGYELSTALDQIIKVANASGTPFEELGGMVDMWALAANKGATDISEMGEALTRMGSTVQFAGGMDEVFTMLTVLANMGTVGTEAGTLLRNSMLRLVAPTKKAADAMAGLQITDSEADELANDAAALEEANKQLEKYGFSVYDEKGELRDMTAIFGDLSKAVNGMTDQERNTLLSAIFPTRTITGAMNLLKAFESGSWTEILAQMAEAAGYAKEVGDIQNQGYGRQIELFDSKVEALKTKIGSIVAPNIEGFLTAAGGVLDKFNSLDDRTIASLTGMLEGLATAGPLMIGATAITNFLSGLTVQKAAIMAAAGAVLAISAAIGSLIETSKVDWRSNFGDMSLDLETLNTFLDGMHTDFVGNMDGVSGAYIALTEAISGYEAAVGNFMSSIDTAAITGKTLTQPEIDALYSYGTSIGQAVYDGIMNAETIAKTALNGLAVDDQGGVDPSNWAMYNTLWNGIEGLYGGLNEHAADVGARLGQAMADALRDKTIDIDEQAIIQKLVDEYNEIERQVAAVLAQQNLYEQIEKASRVSWDSFADFAASTQESYGKEIERINAYVDGLEAITRMAMESDTGTMTDDEWRKTDEYKWYEQQRTKQLEEAGGVFSRPMDAAVSALMAGEGVGDAWGIIQAMKATGASPEDFADPGMWSRYSDVSIPELATQFSKVGDVFAQLDKIAPDVSKSDYLSDYRATASTMYERSSAARDMYYASGLSPQAFAKQYNPTGAKVDVTANTAPAIQQASAAASQISSMSPTMTVNANVRQTGLPSALKFAEGGRATQASIFGEAGAEWAIPEQHTERTASLLDSARRASGFTWGELIERAGGLNAKSGGSSNTLVYSPTINATDSSGLSDVLAKDKAAMKRWWDSIQRKNSMEVYA